MDPLVVGLAAAVALLFGAVGYIGRGSVERSRQKKAVAAAADEASGILARAREEAENLRTSRVLEGKERVIRLRESWEQEEAKHREEERRSMVPRPPFALRVRAARGHLRCWNSFP